MAKETTGNTASGNAKTKANNSGTGGKPKPKSSSTNSAATNTSKPTPKPKTKSTTTAASTNSTTKPKPKSSSTTSAATKNATPKSKNASTTSTTATTPKPKPKPTYSTTATTPARSTTTTTTTSEPRPSDTRRMDYVHSRFRSWVSLTILSLVALLSIVSITDHRARAFREKWCLAMTAISMGLAFLASTGHALIGVRNRFISSSMELIMAVTCMIAWICALPILTSPRTGATVTSNANLYFASWGSFIFSILLVVSVGKERGLSAARDPFRFRWLLLAVSSLIVMVASSRNFEDVCAGNSSSFCGELKMGISLGAVSVVIATIMVLLMWFTPAVIPLGTIGAFFCLCELVIWGVLLAYLTFDDGPASGVGNLFFGIWVSAILALELGVFYAMSTLG